MTDGDDGAKRKRRGVGALGDIYSTKIAALMLIEERNQLRREKTEKLRRKRLAEQAAKKRTEK